MCLFNNVSTNRDFVELVFIFTYSYEPNYTIYFKRFLLFSSQIWNVYILVDLNGFM